VNDQRTDVLTDPLGLVSVVAELPASDSAGSQGKLRIWKLSQAQRWVWI